jgi:hypothetical protein
MRYLESHQSVLQQLVQHLDTTSIAEIVVRLVGAEEQTGMYLTPSQVRGAWPGPSALAQSLCAEQGRNVGRSDDIRVMRDKAGG